MAAPRNSLPFQYPLRGQQLQYLHGDEHAHAVDQRDVELENFLGRLQSNDEVFVGTAPPAGGYDLWFNPADNTLHAWNGSAWFTLTVGAPGPAGPQGPMGPQGQPGPAGPPGTGGGGGTGGTDEVWIGTDDPIATHSTIELWVDSDATAPPTPPGPTGPAGPAGPAGAAGPTGPTGATGPKGDPGATGAASTVPGPQGPAGSTGPAGPGVAAGGTTDQVLAKVNATDYNTKWINLPVSGDEVFVGPSDPGAAYELWVDSDADPGVAPSGSFTNMTLSSGFSATGAGYASPGWRAVGDRIEMCGLMNVDTAIGVGTWQFATLPTPSVPKIIAAVGRQGSGGLLAAQVRVSVAGVASINVEASGQNWPSGSWITLDNVNYVR